MSDINVETVYFEKTGETNTEKTLKLAGKHADELGVQQIIVATTTGTTGVKAMEILGDYDPVIVTHSTGFKRVNEQELTEENKKILSDTGARVLTCQHSFGGVGRAVRKEFGTYKLDDIIACTLRTFGEGMKVAFEITLMATDAGLVRTDKDAIAIGGTRSGVDTAVLIKPANAQAFFDLQLKEIICKPHLD